MISTGASSFQNMLPFFYSAGPAGQALQKMHYKKLLHEIIYGETHNRNHNIYNVLQSHQISGEGINCPAPTLK